MLRPAPAGARPPYAIDKQRKWSILASAIWRGAIVFQLGVSRRLSILTGSALVALVVIIAVPQVAPAQSVSVSWPQFHFDPPHTGFNSVESAISPSTVARLATNWTGSVNGAIASSPAIVNGVVYVGSSDHKLYAFDAAGLNGCVGTPKTCSPLWTAATVNSIVASPAVVNGVAYVVSNADKLYAFDANGKVNCSGTPKTCVPLWTAATGGATDSSPTVVNSVLYLGSSDDRLYAFDATGNTNCSGTPKTCLPLWTAATSGTISGSPAVAGNVVYIESADGRLYAFDASGSNNNCTSSGPRTCNPLWSGTTNSTVGAFSSPAVAGTTVYVGSDDGRLYAFDAAGGEASCSGAPKTCSPLWTGATRGVINSSPAVDGKTVYVGSDDGRLYAFDAAGVASCSGAPKTCQPLWTASTNGPVNSSPAVANGVVYVGSNDSNVYAFDAAGSINCSGGAPRSCSALWSAATHASLGVSSPAVANGVVYVGSSDQNLYAFSIAPPTVTPTNTPTSSPTSTLTPTSTPTLTPTAAPPTSTPTSTAVTVNAGGGSSGGGGGNGPPAPPTVAPVVPPTIAALPPTSTPAPAPTSPPPPTALPAQVPTVEVAGARVGQPAPLRADECARNPYLSVQAVIESSVGGSATSADGSLTVRIPSGQKDTYTLTIAASAVGADGTPAYGNVQVAKQWYMVNVMDSSGNLVVSFNPPMSFSLTPSPCGLKLDQGDWNAITLAVLDPVSGSFKRLQSSVSDDGMLATSSVDQLAPVPAPPTSTLSCAAPAPLAVDPSTGGSIAAADGSLTLNVPPGERDALTLALASADDVPAFSNLRVGTHSYAMSAVDSTGAPVTNFDPPLSVIVVPGQCTLNPTGGDWSDAGVFALDPSSGVFQNLVASIDASAGIETATLPSIGVAPVRPNADAGTTALNESGEIARQTIDQITAGDHEDLPPPQVTGDCTAATASVAASNQTDYPLSLYFAGASGQTITIGAGVSLNLQFAPGHYDVAASVPAPDVTPFLGAWDLENCAYAYQVLIVSATNDPHSPTTMARRRDW